MRTCQKIFWGKILTSSISIFIHSSSGEKFLWRKLLLEPFLGAGCRKLQRSKVAKDSVASLTSGQKNGDNGTKLLFDFHFLFTLVTLVSFT